MSRIIITGYPYSFPYYFKVFEYVKNKDAIVIFEDLIRGDLQKFLSQKMKKIYPLSLCEIRIIKVEKEKN